MADVVKYLTELFAASGTLWCVAVAGLFIAGAGEKAYPNEGGRHEAIITLLSGIAALVTPFLLFVHAFWAIAPHAPGATYDIVGMTMSTVSAGAAIALFAVMAVLIVAPSLLGLLIAAVAPPLGKLLYAIAPYLNIAMFALTVYVAHDSLLAVINAAMHRPI
jgi:hypothetical protein